MSDIVLVQLIVSLATLGGLIITAVVQRFTMIEQRRQMAQTKAAVHEVGTVVNGSHHEALRQIEELKGEIRRLNASPSAGTTARTPSNVTMAGDDTGLISVERDAWPDQKGG